MYIPSPIRSMLTALHTAGYAGYLVGGCVRDALLGLTPHDYDIATDAVPEEIIRLFGEAHCTCYGKAFGTVGVRLDGGFSEITTFRTEADYRDCRHPGVVAFTKDVREDLSRRDFTCNAIAYDPRTGLLDPFGGAEDLKQGILRCVGVPSARMREDALRILRGMRFCARYGLQPEPLTDAAMRAAAGSLRKISVERIFTELCGMLTGEHITGVLLAYPHVLAVWIPEIAPCIGFSQHSRYHDFPVWEHIARSVGCAERDLTVRMTMLLHDLAKPKVYHQDGRGGHFPAHAPRGAAMADQILKRLRCDNRMRAEVCRLVALHRDIPGSMPAVRRLLGQLGEETFRRLLAVQDADRLSKRRDTPDSRAQIDRAEAMLTECLSQGLCCTLRELAVNGKDVMAAGFSGEQIGSVLHALLDEVTAGTVENERDVLLRCIGKMQCRGNM